MNNQINQQTYLLRLWQSDNGSWRILLQDSNGEPPEGFTTMEDLFTHLKMILDKPSADDHLGEQSPGF